MAFIVKKNISGKTYYYLRESKRVDGKVKAVTLGYLGKTKKEAEKNVNRVEREYRKKIKEMDEKQIKVKKPEFKQNVMNEKENIRDNGVESKDFASFVIESGLIWGPSPEIYGGVAGFYTYGPLGKLLKNKVEESVRRVFNSNGFREIEGPTVLPDVVWESSGHLGTFSDRVIKCEKCESVFRADKLIEEKHDISADAFSDQKILDFISDKGIVCPSCSGKLENKIGRESLMMKTKVAGKDASLRPETATVTYLPFLRTYNYFRRKLPFGVYQIGKAYRNEISPRQNVLRGREFTQAEGQIFVDPEKKNDWEKYEEIKDEFMPFWTWQEQKDEVKEVKEIPIEEALKKGFVKSQAYVWCLWLAYMQFVNFGIPREKIRLRQHWPDEKAFYADDAWDIEVNLNNYGWTELAGVHDRTDYDLKQHSKGSGVQLEAVREDGKRFFPHILEIAFGTDRPTYALIDLFYEKKDSEEGKTAFRVPYHMAPIDVSVFPLMKKPELVNFAKDVKSLLEMDFIVDYDVSGSIGKRYLRSASAGTPYAITVDYESLTGKDVTIRDRDSEKQVRVKISELRDFLERLFDGEERIESAGKGD
ncbi:glycine--tRNA ligase [Candidatus Pacearchaeota archaeon CG10_big_fil_rev_8_21_14_0_10_34_76]|nr:MAG: glycine--tRNA ligase [Candidatus Pacearchaeota archaeon CG10_big_fil_rev_8_21_14_0_10_34_76]